MGARIEFPVNLKDGLSLAEVERRVGFPGQLRVVEVRTAGEFHGVDLYDAGMIAYVFDAVEGSYS